MPTLKDKIYGSLDWDEETKSWYGQIEDEDEEFELIIESASAMDFLAVRNTYQTFHNLLTDLLLIAEKASLQVVKNNDRHQKKSEKAFFGKLLGKTLSLNTLVIKSDLSSELFFSCYVWEESGLDGEIHVILDPSGKILDTHVDREGVEH